MGTHFFDVEEKAERMTEAIRRWEAGDKSGPPLSMSMFELNDAIRSHREELVANGWDSADS